MRVVAVYSWARDVTGAVVHTDGSVEWRRGRMSPGEDDHAVVALARALAGEAGTTGLTIGDADASWALARGVDSAMRIADVPPHVDESATAAVLAAAVGRLGGADVVVIGDAEEHPGVGVALAGHLGVPSIAGVLDAEVADGRVVVRRRVGDLEEQLSVPTPAVLVVAAQAAEPKAPGMKELLAARKRPVTTVPADELGVPLTDTITTVSTRRPETTAARLFTGAPTDAARQLVAALRTEGVL